MTMEAELQIQKSEHWKYEIHSAQEIFKAIINITMVQATCKKQRNHESIGDHENINLI